MTETRDIAVYWPHSRVTTLLRGSAVGLWTSGPGVLMEGGELALCDPRCLVVLADTRDVVYSPRGTFEGFVLNEWYRAWLKAHPKWPDATDLTRFKHVPWAEMKAVLAR